MKKSSPFGSFQLISGERTLFEEGKALRRAFDILVALIERAGEGSRKKS
jgi:hypothetical protein